jgi:hypothetical protein
MDPSAASPLGIATCAQAVRAGQPALIEQWWAEAGSALSEPERLTQAQQALNLALSGEMPSATQEACVLALLTQGIPGLDLHHALMTAVGHGWWSVVQRTLDETPFIINLALKEAAWNGHAAIVGLLLQHADIKYVKPPFRVALRRGHMDCLRTLCQYFPVHLEYIECERQEGPMETHDQACAILLHHIEPGELLHEMIRAGLRAEDMNDLLSHPEVFPRLTQDLFDDIAPHLSVRMDVIARHRVAQERAALQESLSKPATLAPPSPRL